MKIPPALPAELVALYFLEFHQYDGRQVQKFLGELWLPRHGDLPHIRRGQRDHVHLREGCRAASLRALHSAEDAGGEGQGCLFKTSSKF